MEKVANMPSGVGLGQYFCVVVVDTTCYSKNQSLTSTFVDKTRHRVWYGNKSYVAHLRVFGCDSFMHVPKKKMSKLDYKVEKCIFCQLQRWNKRLKIVESFNKIVKMWSLEKLRELPKMNMNPQEKDQRKWRLSYRIKDLIPLRKNHLN